jgi:hypothetical protein
MRFAFIKPQESKRAERASTGRIVTVSYREEKPIALRYSEDIYGYTG